MTAPPATRLEKRPEGPAAAEGLLRLIDDHPGGQEITVCLTGASARQQVEALVSAHQACGQTGRRLTVEIELDGGADVGAALGRQASSLAPVLAASRSLRKSGIQVRWLVPLLRPLVHRLEALVSLAQDEGVDALLLPAAMARAQSEAGEPALDADETRFALDLIAYRLLDEDKHRLAPARLAYYRALHQSLAGDDIPTGLRESVMLADDESRWVVRREVRPAFMASGASAGERLPALLEETRLGRLAFQALEVGGVLLEGQWALLQWIAAMVGGPRPHRAGPAPDRRVLPDRRLPSVLLIGAYGGDHIGDAAILGGVLLRIHRRHGTTRALLMSQRPAHTRRLVTMIDTPVEVEVDVYEQPRIAEYLSRVDGVVFAGGPLTDLPKQLVKHLYAVARARRRNQPFIIEGIGAGPFVRSASAWAARRVVRMAERITVRTAMDAEAPLVRGLAPGITRDPAFDYLATRPSPLTRLAERDRQWIETLLQGTAGRLRIGLNLRPIRDLYTVGVSSGRRPEHTRAVEARFEQHLAEGLRQFQRAAPAPPCFLFFPMNAIQFGSSDLRSAYRLQRLLGGEVDLRVWEGDPSIDGVVALLRQLDIVVAMRFHAAIYALAQGRRVIGIDYRIGRRDKVAALLSDFGQSENCCRIDELTAEWLKVRLEALAPTADDARVDQARARDTTSS